MEQIWTFSELKSGEKEVWGGVHFRPSDEAEREIKGERSDVCIYEAIDINQKGGRESEEGYEGERETEEAIV